MLLQKQNSNLVKLPSAGTPGIIGRDRIISMLVRAEVITSQQADDYKRRCNSAEDVIDLAENQLPQKEEEIIQIYAKYYGAQFNDLRKLDREVLKTIPKNLAQKFYIIPVGFRGKKMQIAVAYPSRAMRQNLPILDEIARKTNVTIDVIFTTSAAVRQALGKMAAENGGSQDDFLKNTNIPEAALDQRKIDYNIIAKLPQDIAKKYKIIIFDEPSIGKIKLGMVDPKDSHASEMVDYLARENNVLIERYSITEEDFNEALKYYDKDYKPQEDKSAVMPASAQKNPPQSDRSAIITQDKPKKIDMPWQDFVTLSPDQNSQSAAPESATSENNIDTALTEPINSVDDLEKISVSGNVPIIVFAAIKLANRMKASDIHIEARKDDVLVRFRIDGQLQDIIKLPTSLQKALVARIKILAKLKIDETRIPQDGRFDVLVGKDDVDIRVSVMNTVYGEKVEMRLLDKNAGVFKLESLGMTGENYKRFVKAIDKPFGVVMVTGPTGAGKSTTLYAAINRLKKSTLNIVTLEDPVEYEIDGINQVQIQPNIGFTFAEGLSAVLRQDPNVIMVGEVRDAETANLVTHAALTGHLVLTTLHTNDASGAMPRLMDMNVEPFLISSAMNVIVGQRLVRRICTDCRAEIQVPAEVKAEVERELANLKLNIPIRFFEGKGCPRCGNSGYKGRIGIYEVLEVDDGMEQLIIARASADKIKQYALSRAMYPMRIDGFVKAIQGITTVDEVMHATAVN